MKKYRKIEKSSKNTDGLHFLCLQVFVNLRSKSCRKIYRRNNLLFKLHQMLNRREFLKKIPIGTVALNSGTSPLRAAGSKLAKNAKMSVSPNSQINIGLIGKGDMETSDTLTALSVKGIKLVGVCDLSDKRLKDAKAQWGNEIFVTKDYREILLRKDID